MKKVLVIEDDEPMCWLLEKILGKKHKVTTIQNGMEAMSRLSSGIIPDLIISDIKMPSLDGIELLENLQQSGLYSDIPVMILSSYEDPNKRKRCLELGAFHYIVKPFEPQSLLELVDKALQRKQHEILI